MENNPDVPHFFYLLIVLVLVASAWLRLRGAPGKEIKNALLWVIIITILVLVWSLLH